MILFLLLHILDRTGSQASTVTDASSEASGKLQTQPQDGGKQKKPYARSDASSSKDSKSTTSATSTTIGTSAKDNSSTVVDPKMELALEMSKFIGELEYQLDHVVPMAELCFVRETDSLIGCCCDESLPHNAVVT